jgi:hypothetical protein
MKREIFVEYGNKVYAVANWRLRHSYDDVMLLDELDTQQIRTHRRFKKKGLSADQIFDRIYPAQQALIAKKSKQNKVLVDIDLLPKDLLVHLIEVELNRSMPSLIYLPTDDLQILLSALTARSRNLAFANHN